ncbi:LysR family transcriptional regulator [Neisseria animalis]|uniref:LysR family transcriptional regulator n=1 Tax=Neisseria animalis TaxID=492 RepID=A0A5P3MT95_NEIAN|nr:LysR family transcriptional regulator [Neisseria animalis]QEY24837.1 LysR family transcriptional regulator [Neisseria animalis]ROW31564.1 LysR family transcriptional regulator [Neisseria animalis]VEE07968.1 LysR family transcriptional regulator [Neisseria animalis]
MSKLPDFEAWAVFAKVVECGSFSAAAQELNLSQSTVSKAVARLEAKMQTTLFQRTSRKLVLTESGQAVETYARKLLADGETLEAQLRDEVNQLQGKVRFSVPLSFGLREVAPLLPEFCRQYPHIELDMDLSDEQVDLIEGRFDFALRIARLDDSSMLAKRLCRVALLAVASPECVARYGIPAHPKDLAAYPALVYSNAKNADHWSFRHHRQGAYTQTVKAGIRANTADVFLPLLLSGCGVTLIPEFLVCREIREGRLLTLLDDWTLEPISLYLLAPPNPLRPKRVQVLMDFLYAALRQASWAR